MNKESKQESPNKKSETNSQEKDKESYQEIQEEILQAEHEEMIEKEEAQQQDENADLEQELDSEDIEEEIEDEEKFEEDSQEESDEEEQEDDDGEIKFNHWLHSSTPVSSGLSRNSFSKLERANTNRSGSLESSVAFAPRMKGSKEGKKYADSKYDSNKYSVDSVKNYSEQTPGKNSEFSNSQENLSEGK